MKFILDAVKSVVEPITPIYITNPNQQIQLQDLQFSSMIYSNITLDTDVCGNITQEITIQLFLIDSATPHQNDLYAKAGEIVNALQGLKMVRKDNQLFNEFNQAFISNSSLTPDGREYIEIQAVGLWQSVLTQ